MKITVYGHRNGNLVVKKELIDSVQGAIESVRLPIHGGNKARIKNEIMNGLHQRGWSEEVQLSPDSGITITSVRDKVGLCFQSGNMARMYADLLKLEALYVRETIYAGIIVLFTHPVATVLGSNMAEFDRLVRELPIFERVISAPIAIIGIED